MPLQATSGAASYDAFGGGVAAVPQYIEDVFSTYLYTGNNAQRSISNGIDLSTKGGLVWLKSRSTASYPSHTLWDTARGISKYIQSNTTNAEASAISGATYYGVNAFNTDGFSLGPNWFGENEPNVTYASWTFRKQPKFFDVVTYTGDGTATRNISHSLGSVPGCIIIKRTNSTGDWLVRHRSLYDWGMYLNLNLTSAEAASTYGVEPTQTTFNVGFNISPRGYNDSGATYVAYLFAHNAGGFGLTGTDNVISCGSFTTTGAVVNVTLGYEPQLLLVKRTDAADDWRIIDSMRGFTADKNDQILAPNLSAAETNLNPYIGPTATGFSTAAIATGRTYIYIAIRRGPMKVPTSGTSVFAPILQTAPNTNFSVGFPTDLAIQKERASTYSFNWGDRLRGNSVLLSSNNTAAEVTAGGPFYQFDAPTNYLSSALPDGVNSSIFWNFRRAPSFFDEVCYTGTGAVQNVSHNLGVVPELIIIKGRSTAYDWTVYNKNSGNSKFLYLNTTDIPATSSAYWNNTTPTSSVFTLGSTFRVNTSGATHVAYLFATCVGVSKVGSYTGTGATQTIDCGFTGGARFVLIKRTDVVNDWFVCDTARGMVSGTSPLLRLNTTAAEVNVNYVYTATTGFQLVTSNAAVNASGGTYIFLAIA